jgi:hypothetical protein
LPVDPAKEGIGAACNCGGRWRSTSMQLVLLPFTFNGIPTPSWAQSPNESHPWHPRSYRIRHRSVQYAIVKDEIENSRGARHGGVRQAVEPTPADVAHPLRAEDLDCVPRDETTGLTRSLVLTTFSTQRPPKHFVSFHPQEAIRT